MGPWKSERAAKLAVTKADKAYNAARTVRREYEWAQRETGWCEEAFTELHRLEAVEQAAYAELERIHAEAEACGYYAPSKTLRWDRSPTRALIAANMD